MGPRPAPSTPRPRRTRARPSPRPRQAITLAGLGLLGEYRTDWRGGEVKINDSEERMFPAAGWEAKGAVRRWPWRCPSTGLSHSLSAAGKGPWAQT